MKGWLKRLLILLMVPAMTLVLTACPDNGGVGGGGEGAIEEGIEDAGDELEDAGEELENEVAD